MRNSNFNESSQPENSLQSDLRTLMEWARDFRTSRVLTTAVEQGVLERFGEKPKTITDAKRPNENDEAFRRLVRTLASMGLLRQDSEELFEPSQLTENFLLEDAPYDIRPILKLFHRNYDLWRDLPQVLEDGHDVENQAFGDVEFGREFMLAMETRAHFIKDDVAEAVLPYLDDGDRFIDLGGGTGIFTRAILEKAPQAKAELADLPHVLETAREFCEGSTVADRISYRELDFFEEETYGSDVDLALLFSICHMFDPEKNRTLLERTADSLRPGGTLIIRDYVLNDDGVGPREANFFDLHMLLATDGGGNFTKNEFKNLLHETGFENVRHEEIPGHDDLIIADR